MKRFFAAFLVGATGIPILLGQPDGSATPASPPPPPPAAATAPADRTPPRPPPETLRDLRLAIAQGKLKETPALCDRLRGAYEAERAVMIGSPAATNNRNEAAIQTYMACYCIYAKAQVLSFVGDFPGARAALADARAFRTQYPEFSNPRIQPLMQDLDIITAGTIQERSGKLDAAVQTYLPATYQSGTEQAVATGRLAMIELKRGHIDRAQSWAYIHADDPTSQFVLAQIAEQKKNLLVAQRHATTAIGLIQKQLNSGKEYMPDYYVEGPAIRALSRKLPPVPKPAPKPAPPPPPPKPKPTPPPPAPTAAPSAAGPMMMQ